MIVIKNKASLQKMAEAGRILANLFREIEPAVQPGVTTLELDSWIEDYLKKHQMKSSTKGYMSYRHASCISVNDELVHGVPGAHKLIKSGDLVKIDVCASWRGYCADMARMFYVGGSDEKITAFMTVAQQALNKGIEKAVPGNRLSDISYAIQQEIERHGYGVVRDFAGHGIGKQMHEDPELLNYGPPGKGPLLQVGMVFAIEPMITMGEYDVFVETDGWTVKTKDGSLAAHVEDTVAITATGPRILTRGL